MRKTNITLMWVFCLPLLYLLFFNLCLAKEEQSDLPTLPYTEVAVSMDFRDASLKDILKVLSQQSGINFIPSDDVQDKKVTLYLENVPVKNAIESIVKANSLTYEQGPDENIFIVRSSGVVKIKTITKIYTLNFAQVAPLVVQTTAPTRVGTSSSSGSYYGAAPSYGTTPAYGGAAPSYTSGQAPTGGLVSAPGIVDILRKLLSPAGNIVVDQRTNSLIITDIPEQFELLEEMILKLDTPSAQIFIEVEIIETTLDITDKLGLEYGGTSETWKATYTGPKKGYAFPYETQGFKGRGSSATFTFGTLTFGDLALTLKALTAHTDTKYLARPKLLTLNNETAVIDITSDTYVGSVTTAEPQTATTSTSAERITTGVSLRVTPQVNAADYVTMILEPSVSRTEASSINANFLNPITRSAKAKVMVKDGETIFIGGLLDTQKADAKRRVPILSAIPVIGLLFRSDAVTDKQTEILIFITPHIVESKADTDKPTVVGMDEAQAAPLSRHKFMEEALKGLEKR